MYWLIINLCVLRTKVVNVRTVRTCVTYEGIFKRSTFGGVIFVSKMRGFGLVVSEVKPIWIKLYDHSANVPHVLGISLDFCRWERRFTCLTMGSSTSLNKCILLQICEILS